MPSNEKVKYQKNAEERLKKLKAQITSLDKQIRNAEADIEVRYEQKMQQIHGQSAQAKEKLDALRESTQNEWLTLEAGVEQALNTLNEAVDSVKHHISAQPEKSKNS